MEIPFMLQLVVVPRSLTRKKIQALATYTKRCTHGCTCVTYGTVLSVKLQSGPFQLLQNALNNLDWQKPIFSGLLWILSHLLTNKQKTTLIFTNLLLNQPLSRTGQKILTVPYRACKNTASHGTMQWDNFLRTCNLPKFFK